MKRILILYIIFFSAFFIINKSESAQVKPQEINRFKLKDIIKYFPFTKENSLKEWEEKILKGHVIYKIERDEVDAESYVRAESDNAASALYYKMPVEIEKCPVIKWKWCVSEFPKRRFPEKIDLKREEDFAARIYVIFPASFFPKSKTIEYVWAEKLPAGSFGSSAYSKNIKIFVLRSGKCSEDWQHEERDVHKDYIELFGKEPVLNVGAIAFMTDADSTKTRASALYDEIKIGYKE